MIQPFRKGVYVELLKIVTSPKIQCDLVYKNSIYTKLWPETSAYREVHRYCSKPGYLPSVLDADSFLETLNQILPSFPFQGFSFIIQYPPQLLGCSLEPGNLPLVEAVGLVGSHHSWGVEVTGGGGSEKAVSLALRDGPGSGAGAGTTTGGCGRKALVGAWGSSDGLPVLGAWATPPHFDGPEASPGRASARRGGKPGWASRGRWMSPAGSCPTSSPTPVGEWPGASLRSLPAFSL